MIGKVLDTGVIGHDHPCLLVTRTVSRVLWQGSDVLEERVVVLNVLHSGHLFLFFELGLRCPHRLLDQTHRRNRIEESLVGGRHTVQVLGDDVRDELCLFGTGVDAVVLVGREDIALVDGEVMSGEVVVEIPEDGPGSGSLVALGLQTHVHQDLEPGVLLLPQDKVGRAEGLASLLQRSGLEGRIAF